jgi:hypothetical protein
MRLSALFPHLRGLRLVRHCATVSHLTLVVAPTSRIARCPCCRRVTRQVHSHFERRIMDLPCGGRAVARVLQARRCSCRNAACPKRTFRERRPGVVAPRVRGSHGLRSARTRVGMALGGEPGARLARQLSMPTRGDTVLRLVCAAPLPAYAAPRVLGTYVMSPSQRRYPARTSGDTWRTYRWPMGLTETAPAIVMYVHTGEGSVRLTARWTAVVHW